MLASLEEIEDDTVTLIKFLDHWFKVNYDHDTDLADIVGTANVNVHRGKGQRAINSLFQRKMRMLDNNQEDQGKFIPGVGRVKIVPNEYKNENEDENG